MVIEKQNKTKKFEHLHFRGSGDAIINWRDLLESTYVDFFLW